MKIYSLLFTIVLPIIASAQIKSTQKTDTTISINEVIVTATRNSCETKNIPYSSNLVLQKEIFNRGLRTTPEALSGNVGLFIQKTNHGGGSPFIRGLTGNQILFLVDGIRLNNSTYRFGPNQYLNTIDVYSISKIEVARGTGSVQYGSDAIGGAIQIFTKEPSFLTKNEFGANVILKAVSQKMEFTSHGELKYESKNVGLLISGTLRNFGDLIGGDTTGLQSPSGYKENSMNVKLKLKTGTNSIFTVSIQQLEQKNVPLYYRVKLENYEYYIFSPQRRQLAYMKWEKEGKNKLYEKISIISSLQSSLERRSYHKNGNINKFIDEDKVGTAGLTLDIVSDISKNWKCNSGLEFYYDKVNSKKSQTTILNNNTIYLRGLYPDNSITINSSVYSLHHIKINQFQIETGIRYNRYKVMIKDTSTSSLSLGEVKVTPSSLVGNLAVLYPINNFQNIYISFSNCYRIPNIDDMGTLGLVDFRYEVPASNLKPEKSYNTEIGYHLNSRIIEATVSVFYMKLSDLISRVQVPGAVVGGYNVYIKENNQESFVEGIEGGIQYKISNRFQVRSNATYTYGQNISRNEPMRRIPPINGFSVLSYNHKNMMLCIEHQYALAQTRLAQGDKDDNRIQKGGTPGWNIINISGNYSLKHFTFNLGIQNILNADYRTHGSGINGTGRSIVISVRAAI